MKAVKAIYLNGNVKLSEKPTSEGPVEVLVVFPETEDPWQEIIDDPRPRPALAKLVEEVREEIRQGRTAPLDIGQL